VEKRMPYIDYLSRVSLDQHLFLKLEKSNEKMFIRQINIMEKAKYVIAFIYNTYRFWILVRTNRKKEMFSLHQSPGKGVEFTDAYSLNAALRKLKEEIGFKIHSLHTKWLGYNRKYGYDIYAIELDSKEKSW